MLIYAGSNDKMWTNTKREKRNTAFHSLTNSSVDLMNILHKSIEYLNTHHHDDFLALLKGFELSVSNVEKWPEHPKYIIIALHEALKQCKKNKDGFKSIVPGAR